MKFGKYYFEHKFRHSLSKYQILKAILKYKNHPSIIITSFSQRFSSFYFSQVEKKIALLKTSNLCSSPRNRPTTRISEENADHFAEYTCLQINKAIPLRSVQIRTFSGPNFPVVGLNTGKY